MSILDLWDIVSRLYVACFAAPFWQYLSKTLKLEHRKCILSVFYGIPRILNIVVFDNVNAFSKFI